jgi:16S rRNA A1518/A1519 N6-dimethyltransferase RsmA/KsgA/DIM1 with predicted DNA glycosylase/AP lyase activity
MILFQFSVIALTFILSLFAFFISITFFFGAPFVTTPSKIIKEIIKLANIKCNDVIVDMGSGDGRILIEAAKYCKKSIGYEINPYLVLWSKIISMVKKSSHKIDINWKNYMNADLTDASIVVLYSIRGFIPALERKLEKELSKGTLIISYKFKLTNFKFIKKTKSNIFIYKKQ